jgi:hypothetical protein
VNSARRPSASGSSGRSVVEATATMPQMRPATITGAPTDERQPLSRAAVASEPAAAAYESIRAGPRVSKISLARLRPSVGCRAPEWT